MKKKEDATYYGVKEIARRAHVSIATVDRVIHNRTGVSEKTKKRINEIIKELDYQPNILASRLASRKAIRIAVLIPKASSETDFWDAPAKGIARADSEIRKYGIEISTWHFELNDHNSFRTQSEAILNTDIHGVLLAPAFSDEASWFADACKSRKIPFVFIDSDVPALDSLCYIGPHLFQSGYVGAKLLTYRLPDDKKILLVHISAEADNNNYGQIEGGFRSYFTDHNRGNEIIKINIKDTDNLSVARHLTEVFHTHEDVSAIFVTNSRVFSVAAFLTGAGRRDIPLVGYDFLSQNISALNEGIIDFLICHKPEEQGYRGIMALYQTLVMGTPAERMQFMPIDIITKENQAFYQN